MQQFMHEIVRKCYHHRRRLKFCKQIGTYQRMDETISYSFFYLYRFHFFSERIGVLQCGEKIAVNVISMAIGGGISR